MSESWWGQEYERRGKKPLVPERYLERHAGDKTDAEIAEALSAVTGRDVTKWAVTQKRQMLGLNKTRTGKPLFVESTRRRFDNPPTLNTDDVLVLADIHAPFHDADWMAQVVSLAQAAGVKQCIVAGDLVDFQALSGFAPMILAADDGPLVVDDEIGAAGELVSALLTAFDGVTILLGNHEERLARRLGQLSVRLFQRLFGTEGKRAVVSEYHYAKVIDSRGEVWRVTHPRNASMIPVRVAARLTEKYEMNVIAAHGHDWGETTGASGRYAAACGMAGDPARIDYADIADSVRPLMQQGAWMLLRGAPVLLHPKWRKAQM